MTSIRALRRGFVPVTLASAAALISALWIAICAAAPELIWQGLRVGLSHFTRADLLSALLLGLILAFFVDPLTRRIGDLFGQAGDRDALKPRGALFTATLSLSFALASVGVHHALTAVVSGRGAEHVATANSGLATAIVGTLEWGIVPCAITLAWLSIQWRWFKVAMGIIGAASPGIAGWLFSWSWLEVITTTIPSLLILGLGYRRITRLPEGPTFARCAPSVALVAAGWLIIALLLDSLFGFYHLGQFKLYTAGDFWIDVRFYFGWTLGLMLAPSPYDAIADTTTARSG